MKKGKKVNLKSVRNLPYIILWFVLGLLILIACIVAVRTALLPSGIEGKPIQPDIVESLLNFTGVFFGEDASRGLHDTDERLSTKYLAHAVLLHELLIERHENLDENRGRAIVRK